MINIALDTDAFTLYAGNNFDYLDKVIKTGKYRIVLYPINIIELIAKLQPGKKSGFFNYFYNKNLQVVCQGWYEYADYIEQRFPKRYRFVDYSQKIQDIVNSTYNKSVIDELQCDNNKIRQFNQSMGCHLLVWREHPHYLALVCKYCIDNDESLKIEFKNYHRNNIQKKAEEINKLTALKLEKEIDDLGENPVKRSKNNEDIIRINQICTDNNMAKMLINMAEELYPKLRASIPIEKRYEKFAKYIYLPIIYMIKVLLKNISEEETKNKRKKIYGANQLKKAALGDGEFLYSFLITDIKYLITKDKVLNDCGNWILQNLKMLFNVSYPSYKKIIKIEDNNSDFLAQIEKA